jgi:tRNA/rRNA methyltransferase/tRNA (cytidine32/uridine32-2'-O)-methyltransferase
MQDILNRVVLVLYQPQDVVNVAAVIRVMTNFGLSRLRLVEPTAWDTYRIEGIAHQARPVIEAARFYPTLDEAISDCGFVLGTTARPRGILRETLTPRAGAYSLIKANNADPENIAALLFGQEDSGLPNEALAFCHGLVTIPTSEFNPSLNLAQAALVLAYELWLATNPGLETLHPVEVTPAATVSGQPPRWGEPPSLIIALEKMLEEDIKLAAGTEREALFEAIADLLRTLHPTTNDTRMLYSMSRLRAILLRAAPRRDEARLLTHLFQNINRKLKRAEK